MLDSGYLRHAYKTSSKYLKYWLELKYTLFISISIPNTRGNHRKYRQAISRLMRQDNYFRSFCLKHYGHELEFISTSPNDNTLEIRLVTQDNSLDIKRQIRFS